MNTRSFMLVTMLIASIVTTHKAHAQFATEKIELAELCTQFTTLDAYVFSPCILVGHKQNAYNNCTQAFFGLYGKLDALLAQAEKNTALAQAESQTIARRLSALHVFVQSYSQITHKLHLLSITTAQSGHAFTTAPLPVAAQQDAMLTFLQQAIAHLQTAWEPSTPLTFIGDDEQATILETSLKEYLPRKGFWYGPFDAMHYILSNKHLDDPESQDLALQCASYWEYVLRFINANKNPDWQNKDVLIQEQATFNNFMLELASAYLQTSAKESATKALLGLMRDNMTFMYQGLQRTLNLVHCTENSPGKLDLYTKHLLICDAHTNHKADTAALFAIYVPVAHDYFTRALKTPQMLLHIAQALQALDAAQRKGLAHLRFGAIDILNKMIDVLTSIERDIYESLPGTTTGYSRVLHYLTSGKWFSHGILNNITPQADGNLAVKVGGQTITIHGADAKAALAQAALMLAPGLSNQLSRFFNIAPQQGQSPAENAAGVLEQLKKIDPNIVAAIAKQMEQPAQA